MARAFINAALSSERARIRNESVANTLRELGFEVFFPQEELPPGTSASAREILERNLDAIRRSDLIVSILDDAGEGVFIELGFAVAIEKPTILYMQSSAPSWGKVLQGLWEQVGANRKATNLDQLREILRKHPIRETV